MNINDIAKKQHAWVESVGWHSKTPLEALALITSEVGEAVNECRGNEPTSKYKEELADIILRVLDEAVEQEIDIEKAILAKMLVNKNRGTRGRVV